MRAQLEEMLAQHTGRTLEQVRKDIERDKILTAEEAEEYGLIDQVLITSRKAVGVRLTGGRYSAPGRLDAEQTAHRAGVRPCCTTTDRYRRRGRRARGRRTRGTHR